MKKITITTIIVWGIGSFGVYMDDRVFDVVCHLLGLSIIVWVFSLGYKTLNYLVEQLKTIKSN